MTLRNPRGLSDRQVLEEAEMSRTAKDYEDLAKTLRAFPEAPEPPQMLTMFELGCLPEEEADRYLVAIRKFMAETHKLCSSARKVMKEAAEAFDNAAIIERSSSQRNSDGTIVVVGGLLLVIFLLVVMTARLYV